MLQTTDIKPTEFVAYFQADPNNAKQHTSNHRACMQYLITNYTGNVEL